jgi:hypothetical protein
LKKHPQGIKGIDGISSPFEKGGLRGISFSKRGLVLGFNERCAHLPYIFVMNPT